MQFLQKQLADPNVSEYEKKRIRQRLGVEVIYSENDFTDKHKHELLSFVADYLEDQLSIIRKKKKTNSPFDFFTDTLKTIYYLSGYSGFFEEDSLEQLYDIGDFDEIKGIAEGFKKINRLSDAELVESLLKKRKITEKKVEQLLDHFREDENVVHEIDSGVEKLIRAHLDEILSLQNM